MSSKGISTKKADGIAEAIVARLNGQELTRTQRSILRSAIDSPTVQSVISEFMQKKADGIDSTRNNVYDEINTIGGNNNGRETTLRDLSNQGADGSVSGSRGRTRAEAEDRSGISGTLQENDGIFEETLPAARGGLTSGTGAFGNHDYATVTDDDASLQGQKAVFEETYEGGLNASFTWKLRGKDVTLTDVKVQEISYVKRNSIELKSLRGEFNKATRRAFLEDLGNNAEYLGNAGFSETDIIKIQNGRVPDGWQVHHKLPLDDSGTNSFDNLVLIQNEPYHKAITNYQNSIARQMKIGDIQTVDWPILDGSIYPAQH